MTTYHVYDDNSITFFLGNETNDASFLACLNLKSRLAYNSKFQLILKYVEFYEPYLEKNKIN